MLRLRQICLIAPRLEPVVEDLTSVLGLGVAYRDPAVAMFGLVNAILPIGDSIIEVVAPTTGDTPATRFLERRGTGGYMTILDTDSIEPWRTHLARHSVRIAADLAADGYLGLQLHPRDTGGPLLEINWSAGWETGAYHPAGPDWQPQVVRESAAALAEASIVSPEPDALARRWATILDRDAPADRTIELDRGRLCFTTGESDGLAGMTILTTNPAAIREAAIARRCPVGPDFVIIGGVRIRLTADPFSRKEARALSG